MAGSPNTQEVTCKHRQEGREWDNEQRGAHHDEEARAYRFVTPTKPPPLDDALHEGHSRQGVTSHTGGRNRGRAKLQSPDDRQQIEPHLDDIAARRAERGDEEAGQGGAGAASHVKHDGGQANRVGQLTGRHRIGDHGCPSWLMKGLDHGHCKGRRIYVPGSDAAAKDEPGEHGIHQSGEHLGDHDLQLAGVAVGDTTSDWGQHENRDGLDAVHQAELDGGIGKLVHQPATGHLTIHMAMAVAACPDQSRRKSRWRSAANVRRRSKALSGLQDRLGRCSLGSLVFWCCRRCHVGVRCPQAGSGGSADSGQRLVLTTRRLWPGPRPASPWACLRGGRT